MNSWFFTWTLTRIICSESVLVARLAPSGAPGAPRRRDSPRYRPSVSESSSETQPRTWSVVEMNSVLCLRVESRLRGLHAEQQEEHGSAQRLGPVALPRHLLKHPFVLLWADADLQVIAHKHTCRTVLFTVLLKAGRKSPFIVCVESLQQVRWIAGTVWACASTVGRGRSPSREIRPCVFQPMVR